MEFGSELEEEKQVRRGTSKINPFSSSSNSSSPSSSSFQRPSNLVSLAQIYDHHQMGSWLATKYGGQDESTTASCKVDFMDINVNEDQDEDEEEQEERRRREGAVTEVEKEHMFDKVVTPSDVGKLNRLVIPKQHAEQYFPLDSTVNKKGLLLNFEDRKAKLWRFRYSYWNSSQSYVMTKGWSRFVKDKKLDAGDIVSFQRGMGEYGKDKLYIDWRRRPDTAADHHHQQYSHHRHQYHQQQHHHYLSSIPWSPLLMRPPPVAAMGMMQREHLINNNRNNIGAGSGNGTGSSSANYINGYNCSNSSSGTIVYMRSAAAAPQMVQWQQGGGSSNRSTSGVNMVEEEPINMVYESVPVVQGKAAAKRLRLFGVNMDCPISTSSTTNDHDSSSSSEDHHNHQVQLNLFTGTPIHHMKHNNSSTSMSFDLGI